MQSPQPIQRCKALLSDLSPRMVAVSATLTPNDLSNWSTPVCLVNHCVTTYIVRGLLIGLAFDSYFQLEKKLEHHAGSLAWLGAVLYWEGF